MGMNCVTECGERMDCIHVGVKYTKANNLEIQMNEVFGEDEVWDSNRRASILGNAAQNDAIRTKLRNAESPSRGHYNNQCRVSMLSWTNLKEIR